MNQENITDLYQGKDGVWCTKEALENNKKEQAMKNVPINQLIFATQIIRILFP